MTPLFSALTLSEIFSYQPEIARQTSFHLEIFFSFWEILEYFLEGIPEELSEEIPERFSEAILEEIHGKTLGRIARRISWIVYRNSWTNISDVVSPPMTILHMLFVRQARKYSMCKQSKNMSITKSSLADWESNLPPWAWSCWIPAFRFSYMAFPARILT